MVKIIQIDEKNIDAEHICCALGGDKKNRAREKSKKDWLKSNFKSGLVFKRLDERGKVFIEYMPVEEAWKPVSGKNYMLINCLWVSGRFKKQGLAKALLQDCIDDCKAKDKAGIAVVSASKNKAFLTDKGFFRKQGFQVLDQAPPYFELLGLKLGDNGEPPSFTEAAKTGKTLYDQGLSFIYSCQCPFMEEYVGFMKEQAEERGFRCQLKQLQNAAEAQQEASPFGTLGIYYNGEFKTHELIPPSKLDKFFNSLEEK